MLGKGALDEGKLLLLGPRSRDGGFRVAHHSKQFGVQNQEQHVLVHEPVVRRAEAPLPGFGHQGVAHVVVAGGVEERRFEFTDEPLELVPLTVEL